MAKLKVKEPHEFNYTATNDSGKVIKGIIKAHSNIVAIAELRKQGLSKVSVSKRIVLFKRKTKSASAEDITMFTRQMSTMVKSGIPLIKGLEVIIDGAEKPGIRNLVIKVKQDVEAGGTFSEALRKHPLAFDDLFCALVEAGEQAGALDVMLDRIATYKEKTDSLKKKVKKALFYPAAVIMIAAVVTVILLVKVVPTFEDLFAGFGADLPAFTLFVLMLSELLQEYGFYMLIALGLVIWLLVKSYKMNESFRNKAQRVLLKLPVIGDLIHKSVIARFGRTLATTFSAGVPLTDALDSVAKATGNVVYYNAITEVKEIISSGQAMNLAMQQSNIFPSMVIQMVGIGEETGSIDSMLERVANIYEEEVDNSVEGLTTLLEPLIMVFLGVVVGGLVVAMYLPIFKLGSAI